MKTLIIIPARMDGERLPGKPMEKIGDKPLLHHIWDRAISTTADYVVVTSPDKEIHDYCNNHGISHIQTKSCHLTGTHRCAEVLNQIEHDILIDWVVNWQVDCVAKTEDVDRLIVRLKNHPLYYIVTMVGPIQSCEKEDKDVVKVVCSNDRAYWFSRTSMGGSLHHVGIYGFPAKVLRLLGRLPMSDLSIEESLEQLAWIEGGWQIGTLFVEPTPLSINNPLDLSAFRLMVK